MAQPEILNSRKGPADPDNAIVEAYQRRAIERTAPTASSGDLRDTVYSGTQGLTSISHVVRPRNRAAVRRNVSPFSVVIALLITAVVSVMYISNIIVVGQLVTRIGELQSRNERLLNEQEMLRAQINRMSSLERIRQMAETDLGMRNSAALPGWLTVSPERVREIEAVLQELQKRP